MAHPLSVEQAKAFYDRFGAKQDRQGFYEDAALADLIAGAAFEEAGHVFELGCGTGRIAADLLAHYLPGTATYDGVDISSTMVELARSRLQPYGERARVRQIDGTDPFAGVERPPDRIITSYVLDLLAEDEIAGFISGCERVLQPEGRLCMVSLTFGDRPLSRIVTAGWRAIHALSPKLVGGCRPIRLRSFLSPAAWVTTHRRVVSSFGVASEVVVAMKRAA